MTTLRTDPELKQMIRKPAAAAQQPPTSIGAAGGTLSTALGQRPSGSGILGGLGGVLGQRPSGPAATPPGIRPGATPTAIGFNPHAANGGAIYAASDHLPIGAAGGEILRTLKPNITPGASGTSGTLLGKAPAGATGGLATAPAPGAHPSQDNYGNPGGPVMRGGGGAARPVSAPAPVSKKAPAPIAAAGGSIPGRQTTFGPNGDLRDDQILPGADPRLGTTQGQVNRARDAISNGPDRFEIAQQRYNDFLSESAPGDFDAMRAIRQANAAQGRGFSGMAAKGFADLGSRIERDRGVARSRFLGDALEGTIADRRNNLHDLSDLEERIYGQGERARDEFRTERGYQSDTAQQSIENRRKQAELEEYLTQGDHSRNEDRIRDLMDLGYRGNPSGAILDGAQQQQGAADSSGDALAELLRQYAYGRSTIPPDAKRAPGAGNDWGAAASRPYSFGVQF